MSPAMRARLAEFMPILLAVVLPLAGVLLVVVYFSQDQRERALRILAATVLGVFLYALVFA